MMRRLVMAAVVAGAAVVVAQNWPGMKRYLKIRQM